MARTAIAPKGPAIGEVTAELGQKVQELQETRRALPRLYRDEPRVRVTGSPMYRPHFGNSMPIIVNGIAVYVPLDGQPYEIPETFAGIFYHRLQMVDEHITLRQKLSDVKNNSEAYAGEKTLISRG